jgi:hypothetical protein
MTDFSTIAGWSIMTPLEKWNTVARFQKRRREDVEQALRKDRRREHKREYDRKRRKEKQAKSFEAWNPPGGYYPMSEIIQRQPVAVSTVKRYIAAKKVRVYRVGYHIAICEYDVILAIEAGKQARAENGKNTGNRNRR